MPKTRKFYVHGYPVLIDQADWEVVSSFPHAWQINKTGRSHYVESKFTEAGKRHKVKLHRIILGAAVGQVVDHINGNGLDNRRSNLRLGSICDNNQNRRRNLNNSSGYVGVYLLRNWKGLGKPWQASVGYNGILHYVGLYKTKEEAALAYNEAVFRILPPHHAKLRNLNVIPGDKKYGTSKKAA